MARKRMIDPAIWEDADFGSLSIPARLLFIGIVSHADDFGRASGDPRVLGRLIFGFDKQDAGEIEALLQEIDANLRSVSFYVVNDRRYIALAKWNHYQKIQHKSDSKIPAPLCDDNNNPIIIRLSPSDNVIIPEYTLSDSPTIGLSRSIVKNSLVPPIVPLNPNGARPKRKRPEVDYSPDFEAWWSTYPKAVDKPKAYREWLKLDPADRPRLAAATANYSATKDYEFIRHPERFLRDGFWREFADLKPARPGGTLAIPIPPNSPEPNYGPPIEEARRMNQAFFAEQDRMAKERGQ